MDLRLITAILIGKVLSFFLKLTGSGATAAPGLYALKIDPKLVEKLSKKIKAETIIISGTNGKTTTTRLVFDILSKRFQIIHNRAGSNLLRGIASTLISNASLNGKIKTDLALWEVDEATLPEAIKNTKPAIIVLLNLFRDQLDRYGEVETTRQKWQKVLSGLSQDTTLVLNADDPNIAYLSKTFKGKVIFFGVEDNIINLPQITHVADVRHCLVCGGKLVYTVLFSAHMGKYKCPNCGFKRPKPSIFGTNLKFEGDFTTSMKLSVNGQLSSQRQGSPLAANINCYLPGLYNVYNILAASSAAAVFDVNPSHIKKSTESYSSAFGRFQMLKTDGKDIAIFLIKNPTGANEILRILALKNNLNIMVALNDNFADGRDVSWVWDTNWEALQSKVKKINVSGIRAWDMATRLKYAGFKMDKKSVYEDIKYATSDILSKLGKGDTLYVLPTYTALLELQKILVKKGVVAKWQDQ